jgi:hypothetical protein
MALNGGSRIGVYGRYLVPTMRPIELTVVLNGISH